MAWRPSRSFGNGVQLGGGSARNATFYAPDFSPSNIWGYAEESVAAPPLPVRPNDDRPSRAKSYERLIARAREGAGALLFFRRLRFF